MPKFGRNSLRIIIYFSPLIIGLFIGWLLGLSQSQTLGIILGALATLFGSIITAKNSGAKQIKFNRLKILGLILGISLGATGGLFARTHFWFASEFDKAKEQECLFRLKNMKDENLHCGYFETANDLAKKK